MNDDNKKNDFYTEESDIVKNSTKPAFPPELNENEIIGKAINLVEQALIKIGAKLYEEAIVLLRKAKGFYSQIDKKDEIEAIRRRISEIYILKEQSKDIDLEVTDNENKEPEVELSDKAIKVIREAKILIEIEEFDDALNKYDEAIDIYKKTNDESSIAQIYELIDKCYDSKSEFLKKPKLMVPQKEDIIENAAIQRKELEGQGKLNRILELERRKEKEANFENKINRMVNYANKLERDYESEKKKAIREGNLLKSEAPYQQIIKIYHEIQKLLVERGWGESANQYNAQIKFCEEKRASDQKLREIELQKVQKQEEYDAHLKFKENGEQKVEAQKVKAAQQKYQKDLEDEFFQKQITEVINNAQRAVYEYEKERTKAIKEGALVFESVYPKLINVYNQIIDKLKKRGWIEQTKIYLDEITILNDMQKNDERLREIEAQKIMKQREYEQFIKVNNNKIQPKINVDKFETQIYDMIDQALQKERKYEIALRRGKIESPPYGEIIDIYTRVKDMLVKMGKTEEAKIYDEQIDLARIKFQKSKDREE